MRRFMLLIVDLCAIMVATVSALILRDNLVISIDRIIGIAHYIAISLSVAAVVFFVLGLNRVIWRFASVQDILRVIFAVLLTIIMAVAVGFAANRLDGVPRAVPILQGILAVALMMSARMAARIQRTQFFLRTSQPVLSEAVKGEVVLVLGVSWVAELFLRAINEHDHISIAGIIGPKSEHRGRLFHTHPILGTPDELRTVLQRLEMHGVFINKIVVATPVARLSSEAQQALSRIAAQSDIIVDYFAERIALVGSGESAVTDEALGELRSERRAPVSLADIAELPELGRPYWTIKRSADAMIAGLAIVVTAPLLLLISLLTFCDVGTPIFFWQRRPGRFGKPIDVYKFRTMGAGYDSTGRRIPDEERVSPVGSFLRRTRLDELPQLFNILVGQMSFVGPRPLLPADQANAYSARLAIRPGLTGWAQVHGGREVSAGDKSAMDVWYVFNAGFILDLKIAIYTLRMLAIGERANPSVIGDAWNFIQSGKFFGTLEARAGTGFENNLPAIDTRRVA
jgi:lipopolysaccharide/colanic/teichoic acid biosynthesis glycosyltransferase